MCLTQDGFGTIIKNNFIKQFSRVPQFNLNWPGPRENARITCTRKDKSLGDIEK